MRIKADNYFLKSFEEMNLIGKHFNVYDNDDNLVFNNCYINDKGYVCYGEDDRELWATTMELLTFLNTPTSMHIFKQIQKKKKLRDLTEEEYNKWQIKNCEEISNCEGCMFDKVICQKYVRNCWIDHKDLYSDKFLNQEIEVEE